MSAGVSETGTAKGMSGCSDCVTCSVTHRASVRASICGKTLSYMGMIKSWGLAVLIVLDRWPSGVGSVVKRCWAHCCSWEQGERLHFFTEKSQLWTQLPQGCCGTECTIFRELRDALMEGVIWGESCLFILGTVEMQVHKPPSKTCLHVIGITCGDKAIILEVGTKGIESASARRSASLQEKIIQTYLNGYFW